MSAARALTKPGRYGTLTRYAVRYRVTGDKGSPEMVWCTWAYDVEHAVDRFLDGDGDWEILGINKVPAN